MNNTQSLLVVGSVAYDDIETPQSTRKDMLGGSATYFSIAASHLSQPRLVGVVGRDFRNEDRSLLQESGIDTAGLMTNTDGDTFRWGGRYHENMNERTTLYTALNVFETFKPVLPDAYTSSQWVFLGNIDPVLQSDVLTQIQSPRFVALDTMNFWIEGRRSDLLNALKQVNGIIINDEEAHLLTGASSLMAMARGIRALGPTIVIIKRGEHGAVLYHQDTLFFAPAFPVDHVVDPTGAGDTFAGGFMASLSQRGEMSKDHLRRAVIIGSVLASFCVEGFGVERLLDISQAMIRERYQHIQSITSCPDWVDG
jgi:sugar/nucleoside kinase (ribokinase family)